MSHDSVMHAWRLARRVRTLSNVWLTPLACVVELTRVTKAVSGHKPGPCGTAGLQWIRYELVVLQVSIFQPARSLCFGFAFMVLITAVGVHFNILLRLRVFPCQLFRVRTAHETLVRPYTPLEHHSSTGWLDLGITAFIHWHRVGQKDNIFLCSLLATVDFKRLRIHKNLKSNVYFYFDITTLNIKRAFS